MTYGLPKISIVTPSMNQAELEEANCYLFCPRSTLTLNTSSSMGGLQTEASTLSENMKIDSPIGSASGTTVSMMLSTKAFPKRQIVVGAADGARRTVQFAVESRDYVTQRLKVAPKHVDLSFDALERTKRERERLMQLEQARLQEQLRLLEQARVKEGGK